MTETPLPRQSVPTAQRRTARRGPLIAVLAAGAISITGNNLAAVAIPWFVLQTTGSAARTGVAAFFNILPIVIATLFGGALVDRLGFKRSSILADVASCVAVALIPILHSTIGLHYWQLLALIFFGALLDAPGGTARNALVPELAQTAGWTLEQATSATQVVERTARLLGAPLGGVLIAAVGIGNVLLLDAASFVVSAALIGLFVPAPQGVAEGPASRAPVVAPAAKTDYLAEVRAGLAFILRDALMRSIILVIVVVNCLDAAMGVAYVAYMQERFGSPVSLGLMLGLAGGGAALGALWFATFGKRYSRRVVFLAGFLLLSCKDGVLALFPPLWVVLGLATLVGLAAGPINPILDTVSLERIPPAMRGRVLGAITALACIAMPLGALVGGYALEWLGLRPTMLAAAVVALATTGSLFFNRALVEMERQEAAPQEPVAEPQA